MMRIMIILNILTAAVYAQTDSLYLRLPDEIYLSDDSVFSVYYNNLIAEPLPDSLDFTAVCSTGFQDSMKYNLDSLTSGVYKLKLSITDSVSVLECDSSTIIVVKKTEFFNDTLNVLVIGDSYTYSGVYLKYLQNYYNNSSYYPMKYLGTNYYPDSYNGTYIYHEGYLGKYWYWFANYLESPFVFDYFGNVDFTRYISGSINYEIPDFIIIFLGLVDIGSADPASIETIDEKIDLIFDANRMRKLIGAIESALPDTRIGIVLTPPINEREYTYTNPDLPNFSDRKKIHHRLVQRYIDFFKEYNNDKISVIPAYLNIDTYSGFGEYESIHPNDFGYRQIAHSIYGWIKYQLYDIGDEAIIKNLIITVNRFSVDISWEYPVSGVSYNIYRTEDPYSSYYLIGTTSNLYFTDTNISGSNHHFYMITAVEPTEK